MLRNHDCYNDEEFVNITLYYSEEKYIPSQLCGVGRYTAEDILFFIIYSNILLYIWECSHCTLSSIDLITHYLFLHILLLQRKPRYILSEHFVSLLLNCRLPT